MTFVHCINENNSSICKHLIDEKSTKKPSLRNVMRMNLMRTLNNSVTTKQFLDITNSKFHNFYKSQISQARLGAKRDLWYSKKNCRTLPPRLPIDTKKNFDVKNISIELTIFFFACAYAVWCPAMCISHTLVAKMLSMCCYSRRYGTNVVSRVEMFVGAVALYVCA